MDDQLDNDLKNRIREVFDNFEDPTADEGWMLLREKFPVKEKQRPPVWLWWGSVAAALLLFLGIGIWVASNKTGNQNNNQTLAVKPAVKQQQQIAATDTAPELQAQTQTPAATIHTDSLVTNGTKPVGKHTLQPNTLTQNHTSAQQGLGQSAVNQPANAGQSATQNTANGTPSNPAIAYVKPVLPASQSPANSNVLANMPPVKKPDSAKSIAPKTNQQQYAANTPAVKPANTSEANTLGSPAVQSMPAVKSKPKANSMEALFASEDPKPKKIDQADDDKKVRFAVYAATFFNYAKGSQNQVNAGAGFTSDIKLSKNLKLSTGVLIAQNTLSFDKSAPESNNNRAATFSPALAVAYTSEASFDKVSSAPVFKNYNANLVGLDIPINLKYEFNPQTSDTYVSAGLSSGTFINEAYTASYSYPALARAAGIQQQPADETTRKSFDSFYFAKTLNVSFGVGYPIGKSNKLIIEPFLKYPLDGLGAQQIKFGSGGLNLKLNFTTSKK